MTIDKHTRQHLFVGWTIAWMIAGTSCSNKTKEECPDPAQSEKAASGDKAATATGDKKELDWCRACVVGPHGFMSCQRVAAESPTESRGALKERARDKACEDSGFTKDACPETSVIAITCKGDEPPKDKTAAGKAMLNALKKSGPLILKSEGDKPSGAGGVSGSQPPPSKESTAPEAAPPDSQTPKKSKSSVPVV